jgi:tetratricopeptide (TPR) repeat protein
MLRTIESAQTHTHTQPGRTLGRRRSPGDLLAAFLVSWILALCGSAGANTTEVPDAGLEGDDDARATLMADVVDYQSTIAAIEDSEGAFSAALTEELLGLGLALQRNGDHAGAIDAFKRGVHLARINEGLYSGRQMALLKGEIASLMAIGDFQQADERQRYLYRVQVQTLSDVTRGQALIQHAEWQRKAYDTGIGDEPMARLIRMSSLYRLALTEFARAEGDDSPLLLPALYGMLRAQYMLSGFVGETSSGQFRTGGVFSDEDSQKIAYRNQSFKQGSAIIRAIYDVKMAQPERSPRDTAELMLMLGDWQLWHGKRGEAMETYAELYRELDADEAAQALRTELFNTPQPLPALPGVRALPEPSAEIEGRLLLEFGVNERGRVVDLARLDDYVINDEKADDIMRRMRQTPFRPRIDDGMPVETEELRWAYDTALW